MVGGVGLEQRSAELVHQLELFVDEVAQAGLGFAEAGVAGNALLDLDLFGGGNVDLASPPAVAGGEVLGLVQLALFTTAGLLAAEAVASAEGASNEGAALAEEELELTLLLLGDGPQAQAKTAGGLTHKVRIRTSGTCVNIKLCQK